MLNGFKSCMYPDYGKQACRQASSTIDVALKYQTDLMLLQGTGPIFMTKRPALVGPGPFEQLAFELMCHSA